MAAVPTFSPVERGLGTKRDSTRIPQYSLCISAKDRCGNPVEDRWKLAAEEITPQVFRYRSRELPDKAKVAELAEEAIYKSNRARAGLACEKPAAYAYGVFRRDANEYIESERRMVSRDAQFARCYAEQRALENGPEQIEQRALLRQALDTMDPEVRLICYRKYTLDQTWEEISEALSTPVGSLASKLHRSFSKLRDICSSRHGDGA